MTTYDNLEIIIGKFTFNYNSNNLKESVIATKNDGVFVNKTLFEYDKNGNLIKETTYDSEILGSTPKFDNEVIYFYKNNNIVENHRYLNLTGEKQLYSIEYYDSEQRITKEKKYYLGKLSIETFYMNGFESIEKKYNDNGKVYEVANLEYDERGNILGGVISDLEYNYQTKFGYSYDKNGMKSIIDVD